MVIKSVVLTLQRSSPVQGCVFVHVYKCFCWIVAWKWSCWPRVNAYFWFWWMLPNCIPRGIHQFKLIPVEFKSLFPWSVTSYCHYFCQADRQKEIYDYFNLPSSILCFCRSKLSDFCLLGASQCCQLLGNISFLFFLSFLFSFFYCSGFCHTLKWISHGFTCVLLLFLFSWVGSINFMSISYL